MIISIEGNIAGGKTHLFNKLKEYYRNDDNVIFVGEPIDTWMSIKDNKDNDMLTKFYNDKKKYSFSFQVMAFITIFSNLKQIQDENPEKIIITERSIFTTQKVFAKMLYYEGFMEDTDYIIYNKLINEFISQIQIDKIIYLTTPCEICGERIRSRDRKGESSISLGYLIKVDLHHKLWLNNTYIPVLELENNDDDNILSRINDFIQN
jgi:deoxyadenosine/deoxycytidine kinase